MREFWSLIKQHVKYAIFLCFEPVIWIWRRLRPLKVSQISREKTTEHFKSFKQYWQLEYEKRKVWHSDDNFLCLYILRTRKSPFKGDYNLQEAKKFLQEKDIYI